MVENLSSFVAAFDYESSVSLKYPLMTSSLATRSSILMSKTHLLCIILALKR